MHKFEIEVLKKSDGVRFFKLHINGTYTKSEISLDKGEFFDLLEGMQEAAEHMIKKDK